MEKEMNITDKVKEYKAKLKKGLCDYMDSPISERSATAIKGMVECLKWVDWFSEHMENASFEREDAEKWNTMMVNSDGTTGGHWTVSQTNSVAEMVDVDYRNITEYDWNVAMNMMYSDYFKVAEKYRVDTPEFYADMAKAFLWDKDGGSAKSKLASYYHAVVCGGEVR